MKELIKINTNENGQQLVSAKELYLGLGLNKAAWSRWYKSNIMHNDFFRPGIDYIGVQHDVEGNETMDFAISLDFAKHIAMMARTEKSHEYRNYFIECEKSLKGQALNTSELSPELQMFKQIFDTVAKQQLENKQMKAEIKETKEEIKGIREAVTLEPNQWRKDTATLINKMANKLGGFEHIKPIRDEAYSLLNSSYGVDINRRLLNKKKNMALEGCSKSKIDKVNYLDVIAEDKKLVNGYINIVGRLAVKYGI